jgi:hypothetical protein
MILASPKVHLLRYAQPSSLRRTMQVRLIPQVSQALHLELFAVPLPAVGQPLVEARSLPTTHNA